MATVHVFVGQCGTQVGSTFLDTVASEAEASTDEGFQMRVSATHFRPAMRPPRHRRGSVAPQQQMQSSSRTDATRTPRRRTDGTESDSPADRTGRAGPHHYYSLSRYTRYPAAAGAPTENEEEGTPVGGESNRQKEALPQPRCVLVDMEPKVINSTLERANAWGSDAASAARRFYTLAPQQCVTRGEGSGNNWAFGYHQQGQSRREAIAECLRRESEQQGTTVSTFHVMHSIAGGTGSGVGCLVAEEIKAAFPSATLLHSVVWPFRCGEVVTQWYNILMAVSTLRDLADGVCIAYNDVVAAELRSSRAHLGMKDAGEVSFSLINQRISTMLAPLHLPQLLYATPAPLKTPRKPHRGQQRRK